MQEIELRFLVPKARLKGLMRQVKVKSSQLTHLAAHYYDTPDQQLAESGIGLRIRQENDNWVQTIKAGGDGLATRLEHNEQLANDYVQALLDNDSLFPDLSIYAGTAIEPALADFKLKKLTKALTRQYFTDVERVTRLLESDDGFKHSQIEIAYDKGEIIRGSDESQRQAIHEIEFELVSGDLDFLFTTVKTWCKRYKLRLSTITKAERGSLLVHEQNYSPAVSADLKALDVNEDSSLPEFIRAVVHNCLLQILPNSSAIVDGSQNDEHILQLSIGLRRLYTALDTFAGFSDQLDPEWQPILKQTATLLDDYRKLTQLAHAIEPKLVQQGAPKVDWQQDIDNIKVTPIDAVSANDFQLLLLDLIAFTMNDSSIETQRDKPAKDKMAKILSKRQDKVLKAERNFIDNSNINNLNEEAASENLENQQEYLKKLQQHLTSLRYVSEFAAPLYRGKRTKKDIKRGLKRLKKAQKALDGYLAHLYQQQSYQQKADTDSKALYGAGWLAAGLKKKQKRCQKRLSKIQDSDRFWQ